jgi:hypothetical protein
MSSSPLSSSTDQLIASLIQVPDEAKHQKVKRTKRKRANSFTSHSTIIKISPNPKPLRNNHGGSTKSVHKMRLDPKITTIRTGFFSLAHHFVPHAYKKFLVKRAAYNKSRLIRSNSVPNDFRVREQDKRKEAIIQSENNKPKRSLLTLARLCLVYFGIELMFSIEISLTVPMLLKLKVPEK